jgi:hypothetical protein
VQGRVDHRARPVGPELGRAVHHRETGPPERRQQPGGVGHNAPLLSRRCQFGEGGQVAHDTSLEFHGEHSHRQGGGRTAQRPAGQDVGQCEGHGARVVVAATVAS